MHIVSAMKMALRFYMNGGCDFENIFILMISSQINIVIPDMEIVKKLNLNLLIMAITKHSKIQAYSL